MLNFTISSTSFLSVIELSLTSSGLVLNFQLSFMKLSFTLSLLTSYHGQLLIVNIICYTCKFKAQMLFKVVLSIGVCF